MSGSQGGQRLLGGNCPQQPISMQQGADSLQALLPPQWLQLLSPVCPRPPLWPRAPTPPRDSSGPPTTAKNPRPTSVSTWGGGADRNAPSLILTVLPCSLQELSGLHQKIVFPGTPISSPAPSFSRTQTSSHNPLPSVPSPLGAHSPFSRVLGGT